METPAEDNERLKKKINHLSLWYSDKVGLDDQVNGALNQSSSLRGGFGKCSWNCEISDPSLHPCFHLKSSL